MCHLGGTKNRPMGAFLGIFSVNPAQGRIFEWALLRGRYGFDSTIGCILCRICAVVEVAVLSIMKYVLYGVLLVIQFCKIRAGELNMFLGLLDCFGTICILGCLWLPCSWLSLSSFLP